VEVEKGKTPSFEQFSITFVVKIDTSANMKTTLILLITIASMNSLKSDLKIDFGSSDGKVKDWYVISDNVMGGVTTSKLEYTDNSMVLSGELSLKNFGGFSSVKTRFNNFDLSSYKGLKIRYRSSYPKFAFTLENSKNWTYPYYKGHLPNSKPNVWTEATLNFKDFKEYQIGESTGNMLEEDRLKNIVRLGIMTTDKKEGPFSIEVDYIEFFK
jgi:NADH dehydrogenase [ubiquinone] 1 alpha subcomplex assembly factor 1